MSRKTDDMTDRWSLVLAMSLASTACVAAPAAEACPPGLSPATAVSLYFGRALPDGGAVSDADWAGFLDEVVVPRFPEGFTVLDGLGQWRGADGAVVQEQSKALLIVTQDAEAARPLVDEIRALYLERFRQEAVLLVGQTSCVGL